MGKEGKIYGWIGKQNATITDRKAFADRLKEER